MLSFIGGATGFLCNGNILAALMPDGGTFTVALDDANINSVIKYSVDGFTPAYAKIGNTNIINDFLYDGDDMVYLGGANLDALHVLTAGVGINLGNGLYSGIEIIDAGTSGSTT